MKTSHLLLSSLLLGALALVPGAQVGSVVRAQRINEANGGFGGALDPGVLFGYSLAGLGDVDGDGIADLAVSAPLDNDGGSERGAVWILFLNADSTVKGQTKISQTQGGFTGVLPDDGYFGGRIAAVGDLDGDGISELAVTSARPYKLWILLLNANGTVKATRENLYTDPVFVPPTLPGTFGESLAPGGLVGVGDLDGDGLGDLVLGAPNDPEVGIDAGALWIVHLAADGSMKSTKKITAGRANFAGPLDDDDNFGRTITQLGDLDGDGIRELLVLSTTFPDTRGVWILFLDASENVKAVERHGREDYGLSWPSGVNYGVSRNHAWLGDLNGDGQGELAMEFPQNFPGGPLDEGGMAVATVRADGSVQKKVRISHQRGGMGALDRGTFFGNAPTLVGDLDGDGNPEVAVGAILDRANGETTGGAWIVSISASAERNGSGVNPHTLSQSAEPVFGSPWTATLDCSGHQPGMAFVFGASEATSGMLTPWGEALVGGDFFFFLQAPHLSGPAALPSAVPPYDLALIDLPVHIQGLCTGRPGYRLSNALDIVIGR